MRPDSCRRRSPFSPAREIDDLLPERSPAMDAQAIDLFDRWRAGTSTKHSFQDRDRLTAQAAPIGRGACLEFPVKVLRKFLDQQSGHDIERIPEQYRPFYSFSHAAGISTNDRSRSRTESQPRSFIV